MRLGVLRDWLLLALACAFLGSVLPAEAAEKRIALVIGNAAYQAGPLATPANDAGLVAQTLQAAGFDVVGARDLDEDGLRRSLRDFVDKAAAAGPETVAFVYLSGYGLQLEGENYFAPVDLRVGTAADVSLRALRVSDYAKSLAALTLKARFFVLDGARRSPFSVPDKPLAGGLALAEAQPGSLMAFNAAPGTVAPDEKGPYGAYAQGLVEMIREGGLQPGALFDRVRLRVDSATRGAEVPWDSDRLGVPFLFLDRAADAPQVARPDQVTALRSRPLRELGARDAYAACLEADSLPRYQEFLSDYPDDRMARRVRALAAARREALVWRETWIVNTPDAYWSYLTRYPRGPHAWDARRRLSSLAAALDPPPRFTTIVYDVPPPPEAEIVYVARPVLYLDDPVFELPPPPPPAVVFLPPQPAYILALPPPPPVVTVFALPTPPFVPMPAYVSAPTYVSPPPNNVIFQNIHNTTVINEINQAATMAPNPVQNQGAAVAGLLAGAAVGAAAAHIALPPALQQRAVTAVPPVSASNPAPNGTPSGSPRGLTPAPVPSTASGGASNGPSANGAPPPVSGQLGAQHALPGMNGQPLPRPANGSGPGAIVPNPGVPQPTMHPIQAPVRALSNPVPIGEPARAERPASPATPLSAAPPRTLAARPDAAPSVDAPSLRDPPSAGPVAAQRAAAARTQRETQQRASQAQFAAQRQQQRLAAQQQRAQVSQQQQAQAAARRQQQMQAMQQQRAAQMARQQQGAAQRAQQAAQRQRQTQMHRPPPAKPHPQQRCRPGTPCR